MEMAETHKSRTARMVIISATLLFSMEEELPLSEALFPKMTKAGIRITSETISSARPLPGAEAKA